MTRTVLVTGGAGYVGSQTCKALSQAGWHVVAFDNLHRGWRDLVRWGDLIEGDVLNPTDLSRAFEAVKPDVVAHFAALAYVGESVDQPGLYYRNNVLGTLNLLDAMAAHGTENLVFSSTCAIYEPLDTPLTEDTPQAPVNPYGASKMMAERVIRDFGAAKGIRSVALRYFNASGCDPEGETGERHEPETHVIPLILRGALDPDYRFTINGNDFSTPDGTCIRDYIHVTDLADAHLKALEYLEKGGATEAFNLGTGRGTSVSELVSAVERVTGVTIPKAYGPRRPGDPPRLVANPAKAERLLGWTPHASDIDHILKTARLWAETEKARA